MPASGGTSPCRSTRRPRRSRCPTTPSTRCVGTYVLCSVTDPAAALAEVRRVLVPGGRVVFVDHVQAPPRTLKRFVQRVATPISKRVCHGCHWDRDTERALVEAGFVGGDVRRLRVRSMPFGPVPMLLFDGRAPGSADET